MFDSSSRLLVSRSAFPTSANEGSSGYLVPHELLPLDEIPMFSRSVTHSQGRAWPICQHFASSKKRIHQEHSRCLTSAGVLSFEPFLSLITPLRVLWYLYLPDEKDFWCQDKFSRTTLETTMLLKNRWVPSAMMLFLALVQITSALVMPDAPFSSHRQIAEQSKSEPENSRNRREVLNVGVASVFGLLTAIAPPTSPAGAFENKISTQYDDRPKRRGSKASCSCC